MATSIQTAEPDATLPSRAGRLVHNWVYGGSLAGVMLLGLAPTLTRDWPAADVLIFLTLPVYMVHQYEEHDADRFRHYMNLTMAGGRDAMTPLAVFVINIFGVWLPLAACIAVTRSFGSGFGAFAGWLIIVNALLHVISALREKAYNPGLVTAVCLFLPLGIALLAALWDQATNLELGAGLVLAIALHAAIMIYMKRRIAQP
jgi:hypothetical protein